jgi:hypothetical protein
LHSTRLFFFRNFPTIFLTSPIGMVGSSTSMRTVPRSGFNTVFGPIGPITYLGDGREVAAVGKFQIGDFFSRARIGAGRLTTLLRICNLTEESSYDG